MSNFLTRLQEAAAKANAKPAEPIELDFATLEQSGIVNDWETSARKTLLRMFETTRKENPGTGGLDVNFTFKVTPGGGNLHVNAMRSVLGRARKKAMKAKKPLDHFKLLVVEIKREPTHDAVTVVRTKSTSRVAKSVYDDIIDLVTAESETEK